MPVFENLGSLITYKGDDGKDTCLGYLWNPFGRTDVFDPSFGRVEIAPEHVAAHNTALDKAMIDGLASNCQIGQGGSFYLSEINGRYFPYRVTTFMGTEVAPARKYGKASAEFRIGKMLFRGRIRPTCDLFSFKRVA